MSLYTLQKLIRDVNRKPQCREAYFRSGSTFADGFDLAERERAALLKPDVGALYAMGVHGLLLRPFTILHKGRRARLSQSDPARITMPITFAAAGSHVPRMTAWAEAAPVAQKDRVYGAFDRLRAADIAA